mmetsp:Transcript_11572/g.23881  ORF Transcript_11572/g.23881 Transcript_11572/m.23881 type:complete len:207 (-) Transcript_11572:83-703(-)
MEHEASTSRAIADVSLSHLGLPRSFSIHHLTPLLYPTELLVCTRGLRKQSSLFWYGTRWIVPIRSTRCIFVTAALLQPLCLARQLALIGPSKTSSQHRRRRRIPACGTSWNRLGPRITFLTICQPSSIRTPCFAVECTHGTSNATFVFFHESSFWCCTFQSSTLRESPPPWHGCTPLLVSMPARCFLALDTRPSRAAATAATTRLR